MFDQAQQLRERIKDKSYKNTKVIAVTSGKGGVGKSNFAVNFALGLVEKGLKVVIIDADLGMANVDVLMGLYPSHTLYDMVEDGFEIWDVIEKGPNGLEFIAGGSGIREIFHLEAYKMKYVLEQLSLLQGYADYVIIDTGAGVSKESIQFILSADEVILVTTPEPTALTDAYALLKVASSQNADLSVNLVVNRANNEKECKTTAAKINMASEKFLNLKIKTIGYINDDKNVSKSVVSQTPFMIQYPQTSASKSMRNLVYTFQSNLGEVDSNIEETEKSSKLSGLRGFLEKMLSFSK